MANKQSSKKSSKKTAAKKSVKATKKTATAIAATKSLAKSTKKGAVSASAALQSPTIASQIYLRQRSEYVRQNWWSWSIWLDAPSNVLNKIEYVNYRLHSTFEDPVRHHTNSHEKFLLKDEGWGEFAINAEIKPKDGKTFTKTHWLTLEYPQEKKSGGSALVPKKQNRPTVFLSAGLSDLTMANSLAQALRQRSINVLKADELSHDLPWDVAVNEMIKNADLMVVLLSGRPMSSIVREINSAKERKSPLPIVPVLIGPEVVLPDELEGFQPIKLKDAVADKTAPQVAMQVIQRIKTPPSKS